MRLHVTRDTRLSANKKDLLIHLTLTLTDPTPSEQALIDKYSQLVERPLLGTLSAFFINFIKGQSFSFRDLMQGSISTESLSIEQAETGERQIRFACENLLKELVKVDSLVKSEDFQVVA